MEWVHFELTNLFIIGTSLKFVNNDTNKQQRKNDKQNDRKKYMAVHSTHFRAIFLFLVVCMMRFSSFVTWTCFAAIGTTAYTYPMEMKNICKNNTPPIAQIANDYSTRKRDFPIQLQIIFGKYQKIFYQNPVDRSKV